MARKKIDEQVPMQLGKNGGGRRNAVIQRAISSQTVFHVQM